MKDQNSSKLSNFSTVAQRRSRKTQRVLDDSMKVESSVIQKKDLLNDFKPSSAVLTPIDALVSTYRKSRSDAGLTRSGGVTRRGANPSGDKTSKAYLDKAGLILKEIKTQQKKLLELRQMMKEAKLKAQELLESEIKAFEEEQARKALVVKPIADAVPVLHSKSSESTEPSQSIQDEKVVTGIKFYENLAKGRSSTFEILFDRALRASDSAKDVPPAPSFEVMCIVQEKGMRILYKGVLEVLFARDGERVIIDSFDYSFRKVKESSKLLG